MRYLIPLLLILSMPSGAKQVKPSTQRHRFSIAQRLY